MQMDYELALPLATVFVSTSNHGVDESCETLMAFKKRRKKKAKVTQKLRHT